jgi:hypothetical protein
VGAWVLSVAALALSGNVLVEVLDGVYRVPPMVYVTPLVQRRGSACKRKLM